MPIQPARADLTVGMSSMVVGNGQAVGNRQGQQGEGEDGSGRLRNFDVFSNKQGTPLAVILPLCSVSCLLWVCSRLVVLMVSVASVCPGFAGFFLVKTLKPDY